MISEIDGSAKAQEVLEKDREFFAALRREEFTRLEEGGQVYLDWTGTALYPVLAAVS